MSGPLRRAVAPGESRDLGRGVLRLDPADLRALGLELGDTVAITGARTVVARALPTLGEARGQGRACMGAVLRENAGVKLDAEVALAKVATRPATLVAVTPLGVAPRARDLPHIGQRLDGIPITPGDTLQVTVFGNRPVRFRVDRTEPAGPVLIAADTELLVGRSAAPDRAAGTAPPASGGPARAPAFEDIGGLGPQLGRIREIIELPLKHPALFARLGVEPPKGVLLHGPPGCGKTLIARAIAHETQARFHAISGPEIIHKHYGESEARLRKVFAEAAKQAPSILFLDEIDALAPRRDRVQGEVEKRVVATLLTLMDGLERRAGVVVIGATNLPDSLDPALRRPGRFDRELAIPVPDLAGRAEILRVHSRGMPLAEDVDLDAIAGRCHGHVGADLEALCREAAMVRLRKALAPGGSGVADLDRLVVDASDFAAAAREIAPSALREVVVDVPRTSWADVAGLDAVRDRLDEIVGWPRRHPAAFAAARLAPPRGVLLHGPPGCGKTLIARAVANAAEASFLAVNGPELLSRYVGASSRAVRELFARARRAAPCVLFFDELDGLAPRRGGGDDPTGERVLTQLLTAMDGIESLEGVLVLAATNRLDRIDPALLRPGRFDELVAVGPPGAAGATAVLRTHLAGRPVAPDDAALAAFGATLAGWTGARIAGLVRRAALAAVRRTVASGAPVCITADDLAAAREASRATALAAGEAVR